MKNLEEIGKLGFKEGSISECIVTTFNEDQTPNAAPIGVTIKDGKVTMRIHTFTDTCKNIKEKKCCVLNVINNPYLFLKTAIIGQGKGSDELDIDIKQIAKAKNVDAPYISGSDAYVELNVQTHATRDMHDRHGKANVSIIKYEVESIQILKKYPAVINRGLFAAIELAILLSRGKKKNTTPYLKIMKKTLPPDEYEKIEKLLEGRL